ncbi:Beta 1,3(4)-glucanase [Aphelenchoides besseyi]|nr:Beta 1,3(4)-glucanase [Aphelenchoides besseyi]
MISITVLCLTVFPMVVFGYQLVDNYQPSNFLDKFNFETANDPTHGFVNYISRSQAQSSGLIKNQNNQLYIGVDNQNVVANGARGRNSIRIVSQKGYQHGLFILDLQHLPTGCGTWPAYWMVGPNWPNSGELDIIEGVHTDVVNGVAMHTSSGCSISNSSKFTGQFQYSNCDVNAANQPGNSGCSIKGGSLGSSFNNQKGGVYAAEWTSNYVRVWFFSRSKIPSDILNSQPQPANWGKPVAEFTNKNCDLDAHFHNQQIVFDVTFCGDWAGNVWNQYPQCRAAAPSCVDYVRNNPAAFKDAYWLINSLKVYQ